MKHTRLNDYNRNDDAAAAAYAKRVRLNHNIDQFPLAAHIVKQFLASINLLDLKINWPRDMGDHIINDVDWMTSMVSHMLYLGIVGYRVRYLPFYRADLVCSAAEFGGFTYIDSVFGWRSTAPALGALVLPAYVAPGHQPFTYGLSESSAGWLFNGLVSHHDRDYNTHSELIDDTLRASSRSSEGAYARTVRFSPDLPIENVKRSIAQERTNPAYMLSEQDDGFREDAKQLISFTNAMVAGADDPDASSWKPSTIPAGVEQTRLPPPRSFIGGLISIEEQILHRMSLLVFKAVPAVRRCIETCIQRVYDDFLKPEIFYNAYLLIYIDLRDQLLAVLTSTAESKKRETSVEQAAQAFIVFRKQIARFAEKYAESSAKKIAFFANLDVDAFKTLIHDVQERYGGSDVGSVTKHGSIRLLLSWMNYEVLFCRDAIARVQAERHPPVPEKEKKKKGGKEKEKLIIYDDPKKQAEAEEREEKEREVAEWEEAEHDKVTYSWTVATPDIATQDYGEPNLQREKRDQ